MFNFIKDLINLGFNLFEGLCNLLDYAGRSIWDVFCWLLAVVLGSLIFGSIFILLLFGAGIQRRIIRFFPDLFWLILFPSTRIKFFAVQLDGALLRWIKNPTFEMELLAIQSNPHSIQWIKNPPVELQLIAINRGWTSIKHIEEPILEVQLASVKLSAYSIYHIKNQHPEAQRLAQENEYVRKHSIIEDGAMKERTTGRPNEYWRSVIV